MPTSLRSLAVFSGRPTLAWLIVAIVWAPPLTGTEWSDLDLEFFEREVRPILATQCASCHSASNAMSGLRLDSREAVLNGGNRGSSVSSGNPDNSLLIQAVRHESLQMPLGGKLSAANIASLEEWVRRGLPWTPEHATQAESDVSQHYEAMRREHWAFQPALDPVIPDVRWKEWGDQPIDRFVLARLGELSLRPSRPAERATLIRRLSLVLTGLPPSARQVQEFVNSPSPDAYGEAVDRLLESPHFGEHWARHWMDVVRFGETLGNDWNYENNGAWLYRDYLIRALNADVPYDQLVREHLAGDLLEEPRLGEQGRTNESVIGTFFFRLGEQGHDDCTMFREVRTDVVDDQIDALGKAFQGLTVSCARCHDHKLDPIPTADYYGLYGVLDSSRLVTRTVDTEVADAELKDRMIRLKSDIRDELANFWLGEADQLAIHLLVSLGDPPAAPEPDGTVEVLDPDRSDRIRKLVERGKLDLDNPLAAWSELARSKEGSSDHSLAESWTRLVKRYRRQRQWQVDFNGNNFETLADFGNGHMPGWHAEGRAFAAPKPSRGDFSITPGGSEVVGGIYPAGLYTHLLSEKLNGALRSPLLPRDRKFLSLKVIGGKLAAWRTVLDNCMLSEHYQVIDQGQFGWIKIPLRDQHDEYRIYAELVTKHDNPRFPDRPARMETISEELMAGSRSYFGVTRAVLHDCDELPKDELSHLAQIFDPGTPRNLRDLAGRYAAVSRRAVESWRDGTATDDQARWLQWLLSNGFLANSKYLTASLRRSVDLYRALERQLTLPRVVQGMADLEDGHNTPIFRAGDAKDPGALAPRGFLSLLEDLASPERPQGSGRRDVAEVIASPRNPLTARVMVNRIWHYLFGRGLVATVDNLGRFGEQPTHPKLLDHLASQFVEDGWSIKRAIRRVVMSRTFRQASQSRPKATQEDPDNQFLHRYPARRLEAESIRDSILAVSGKLDRSMFGPSIHPYRVKPKAYRKLLSGPLDGNGRRSIYLKVTRHEGAAFLEALDFPAPAAARGRRDVTNVPRQALAMMNDQFVVGEARYWAKALVDETSESVEARLRTMFRTALGRLPTKDEVDRMETLVARFAELQAERPEFPINSIPIWQDVAHTIFNLKEFIYIQ